MLGNQGPGKGEGREFPLRAVHPERRGQGPLPHRPAIKARRISARIPAQSPMYCKCTSHLGFGLDMSEQETREQPGLPDSPVEPNAGSVEPQADSVESDAGSVEPQAGSVEPDTDLVGPEVSTPVPEEYEPTFRDVPAVFRVTLSLLSGSPLVVSGVVLYINTHSPLVLSDFVRYISTDLSAWVSAAISLTGVVIALGGLYFSLAVASPHLNLLPEERTLALRHPSVKPAFARMILSLPSSPRPGTFCLRTSPTPSTTSPFSWWRYTSICGGLSAIGWCNTRPTT